MLKYYNIPGPGQSLMGGNLQDFIDEKVIYKVHLNWLKRYGKVYGYYVGDEPTVIITDLEMLRKIFFEKMSSFKERSIVFIESPLSDGILFCRHHRWKAMRKIMSPTFSKYNMRGGSSTQFIEDSISQMIGYIETKLQEAQIENKKADVDMHDLMKATALHMISSMAIPLSDIQVRENEPNVRSLDSFLSLADKGFVTYAIRFAFLRPVFQFMANHFEYDKTLALIRRKLDSLIEAEMGMLRNHKDRQMNNHQNQLINTLIKLHYEGKMTRREVIGNAEAILVAGYDTTSTTLSYIFWVLAKYPDVQDKLRSDLMAHGVESKYLEQVICETMRLYPTVTSFTTRLATETVEIDGWTIPQGVRVMYEAWLMHRDPNLWPEPEKFDPERFRDGAKFHPCAYAPFGLGERKCLGYQLAKLELKMVTCDILLRYKLILISPQELDLISCAIVITKPKEKIILELERV